LNGDWAGRADTARLAGNGSSLYNCSQYRKSEEFETHCDCVVMSVVGIEAFRKSVVVVVIESD